MKQFNDRLPAWAPTLALWFSRLYLQAHYLTDVIAGYGIGLTWSVLTLMGIEWYLHGQRRS